MQLTMYEINVNDTSTSLMHSDLMKFGARVPSKKMSDGSESLRLSSDVTEKGRSWSVSYYSGIIMQLVVLSLPCYS